MPLRPVEHTSDATRTATPRARPQIAAARPTAAVRPKDETDLRPVAARSCPTARRNPFTWRAILVMSCVMLGLSMIRTAENLRADAERATEPVATVSARHIQSTTAPVTPSVPPRRPASGPLESP